MLSDNKQTRAVRNAIELNLKKLFTIYSGNKIKNQTHSKEKTARITAQPEYSTSSAMKIKSYQIPDQTEQIEVIVTSPKNETENIETNNQPGIPLQRTRRAFALLQKSALSSRVFASRSLYQEFLKTNAFDSLKQSQYQGDYLFSTLKIKSRPRNVSANKLDVQRQYLNYNSPYTERRLKTLQKLQSTSHPEFSWNSKGKSYQDIQLQDSNIRARDRNINIKLISRKNNDRQIFTQRNVDNQLNRSSESLHKKKIQIDENETIFENINRLLQTQNYESMEEIGPPLRMDPLLTDYINQPIRRNISYTTQNDGYMMPAHFKPKKASKRKLNNLVSLA